MESQQLIGSDFLSTDNQKLWNIFLLAFSSDAYAIVGLINVTFYKLLLYIKCNYTIQICVSEKSVEAPSVCRNAFCGYVQGCILICKHIPWFVHALLSVVTSYMESF